MHNTATELVRLGQKVDIYYYKQMRQLDLVKSYSLVNMDLLRDLADKDPSKCKEFFNLKSGKVSDVRFIDKFRTYDSLRQHFRSFSDLFKPCLHGLGYILSKQDFGGDIHSLLLAKSYTDDFNESESYWATKDIYLPAREYYEKSKSADQVSVYPELIHTESLKDYVNMAIELYPYMLIIDDPQVPSIVKSLDNFKINPFIVERVIHLLNGALNIIDEGIHQQEIISGHGWINYFSKELTKLSKDRADENFRHIIEFNPIFRWNLAGKLVEKRAAETDSPYMYYESLLQGRESYPFFEKFMGDRFFPEFINNKWKINLGLNNKSGVLRIDLPESEFLTNEKWHYTADIMELYELRNRLVEHLALLNAYLK